MDYMALDLKYGLVATCSMSGRQKFWFLKEVVGIRSMET